MSRELGALRHPQLRWIWQDARTGLALNTTQYDIILSAPLLLCYHCAEVRAGELRAIREEAAEGEAPGPAASTGPAKATMRHAGGTPAAGHGGQLKRRRH